MKNTTPDFRCAECGWTSHRWAGRCGECQAWGTISQPGATSRRAVGAGVVTAPALPIDQVSTAGDASTPTGLDELDRVLGGGLVAGSVVLLAGEPGVGKSTLLLEVAARCAGAGRRALYVTGEESAGAVRTRAERVGAINDALYLAAENDLAAIVAHVEAVEPTTLIVDSIQTITRADVEGAAGGVTQVREVTSALIALAKARGMATIVVGHVTKDGGVAGPRTLEHLVDVVLHVEGDRHGRLRIVRAYKNRYGPADEIGCFELADDGIWAIPDPSSLFLSDRRDPVSGTAVTVSLEGSRPLLAQIQALVGSPGGPIPRRQTAGIDGNRLAMLCAVLERHSLLADSRTDTYVSTVGGARVHEPSADLAIACALASSSSDRPIDHRVVCVGEVSLAGEVRAVTGMPRRLAEAGRLGFTRALVPAGTADGPAGLTLHRAATLHDALSALTLLPRSAARGPRTLAIE